MKFLLKAIILFICGIFMLPLILISKIGTAWLDMSMPFLFCSQWISLIPSPIGSWCRVVFYWATMEEFPLNGVVGFGAILAPGKTRVGSNVFIADYAIVGYSHIGKNAIIGSRVSIIAGRYQHNFTDPSKKVFDGEPVFECIEIGEDAFLGEGCICMANVGANSIVGAGAVVVKEIPANCVAVGNPARVVKTR